jgi:uncharacterized protein (DUF1697 family)
LIRGINVGRAKRVAMADLRRLFEGLGCRDVRTLLNSGNVIFTPPARFTAERVEAAMPSVLRLSARVTLVSGGDLADLVEHNPLPEQAKEASRLMVAFLRNPQAEARLAPLAKRDWSPELLACRGRAAFLWCPDGLAASPLVEAVGLAMGEDVTIRNWSTVLKIRALACAGGGDGDEGRVPSPPSGRHRPKRDAKKRA